MHARLLLAAIVFPAFTLSAQRPGDAARSGATTAALAGNARLDHARALSASIDLQGFDLTAAYLSGVRLLERLRSALILGVLDTAPGAAEDVGLPAGRFKPYRTQAGRAWAASAESDGTVYPAKRTIEKPDALLAWQPTVSRGSACWWLWVVTGMPACW